MEGLSKDVISEVLTCLSANEIASLVCCARSLHSLVTSMGCLSTSQKYVKPVSDVDRYANNLLLGPAAGTAGAVTFRPWVKMYGSFLTKKMILQSLRLYSEHDAATWLSTSWRIPKVPAARRHRAFLSCYRRVQWDFWLYTVLCNAMESLSSTTHISMHIKSLPAMLDHGLRLPVSSQAFLCHWLCNAKGNTVSLDLCGIHCDALLITPVSQASVALARSAVDRLFEQATWSGDIDLYSLHDFRSSTVAFGRVLATANPCLTALALSHYTFDEIPPSTDAFLLSSYLRWGEHALVSVHLSHVTFWSGEDFGYLLRSLCRVRSLASIRLADIKSITDPPEDPLAIVFEDGAHVRDVRMHNVVRVPTIHAPFHLLQPPGYRCLALSQMFLDTACLSSLVARLPVLANLANLDLSKNGIDGSVLGMLARVLRERNCPLERLNLASNIITGSSMSFFCQALAVNRSLQYLNLSDNFLGTYSALNILETVLSSRHSRVKCLNLDGNQIRYSMERLHQIVLSASTLCLSSSPPQRLFRQVSLKSNPPANLDGGDLKDVAKYKTLFQQEYNVSFLF